MNEWLECLVGGRVHDPDYPRPLWPISAVKSCLTALDDLLLGRDPLHDREALIESLSEAWLVVAKLEELVLLELQAEKEGR